MRPLLAIVHWLTARDYDLHSRITIVWPNDSIPKDECADPTTHDRPNGAYYDPAKRKVFVSVRQESNWIDVRIAVTSAGWSFPPKR